MPFYSYKFGEDPGRLVWIEKELILRSKLSKLDFVTSQQFKEVEKLNKQTQIIKVKDISQYPSKNSKKGRQLLRQHLSGEGLAS